MSVDFEKYKSNYNERLQKAISFIKKTPDFFARLRCRHLIKLAETHFPEPKKLQLLDVGCGVGLTDRHLVDYFSQVHGVDLSESIIEEASRATSAGIYQVYDGKNLPYSNDTFHLVFAMEVLHHVPVPLRKSFLKEMARVTAPGGLVVIFEHNPYNPLTRVAVSRCEFDEGVVLLSMRHVRKMLTDLDLAIVDRRYVTFFPFEREIFFQFERHLKWLPLGAQYCVVAKKS